MANLPNRAKLADLFHRVSSTQAGFAEALTRASGDHVSQQTVQNWLKREQVPPKWVPVIVRASKNAISASELRPDLYPSQS